MCIEINVSAHKQCNAYTKRGLYMKSFKFNIKGTSLQDTQDSRGSPVVGIISMYET